MGEQKKKPDLPGFFQYLVEARTSKSNTAIVV
jgi:hypothetical protein